MPRACVPQMRPGAAPHGECSLRSTGLLRPPRHQQRTHRSHVCRLEHLHGTAPGIRNLTNYITRAILGTGGFQDPRLHPFARRTVNRLRQSMFRTPIGEVMTSMEP